MHFSNALADRFYTTLTALATYANERLDIVVDYPPEDGDPFGKEKSEHILRTIWSEPGIVDDFVRENLFSLPRESLEDATHWKSALSGPFLVAGFRNGCAVMVDPPYAFVVSGVSSDLADLIPDVPVLVQTTLLPYQGKIVTDGFLRQLSPGGMLDAASNEVVESELEGRTIVDAADAFEEASAELRAASQELELDLMLNPEDDEPGHGYHVSELAGLAGEERDEAARALLRRSPGYRADYLDPNALKHPVAHTLADALNATTKARIGDLARILGVTGISSLRKAEAARRVADALLADADKVSLLLGALNADELKLLRELMRAGGSVDRRDSIATACIIEPFTFAYPISGGWRFFVPDDLAPHIDPAEVDRCISAVERADDIVFFVETCAFMYGAMDAADVLRSYRSATGTALDADAFSHIIVSALRGGGCTYDIVEFDGAPLVVSHVLSGPADEDEAVDEAQMAYVIERVRELGRQGFGDDAIDEMIAQMLDEEGSGEMDAWVDDYLTQERAANADFIAFLLHEHARIEPKPLSAEDVAAGPMRGIVQSPEGLALRDFFDHHVPDTCTNEQFGDFAVRAIATAYVEGGSVEAAFEELEHLGCHSDMPGSRRLLSLMANFCHSLPDWSLNGWSQREVIERITGRRVFYNADGSIRRPDADAPCPCGSGKPYRDCCGRRRRS